MKNPELLDWEENVTQYLNSINDELIENLDARNLYYGFDVIDGQLKMHPEILFIGINPGYGDQTRHYQVKFSSDRLSYLDYFDNEYPYPLARETVNIFRLLGMSDQQIIEKLENDCVKTNLYHIITHSEKEIKQCTNESEKKFNDYYHNSVTFCISLINTLKPKVVIFEGKSIYNEIIGDIYEVAGSWDETKKLGYYFSETEKIHFLGYERNRSNILNKEFVAEKLENIFKDIKTCR